MERQSRSPPPPYIPALILGSALNLVPVKSDDEDVSNHIFLPGNVEIPCRALQTLQCCIRGLTMSWLHLCKRITVASPFDNAKIFFVFLHAFPHMFFWSLAAAHDHELSHDGACLTRIA